MPVVLGVDGGGSKSRAVVVDDRGSVLAYARGGATNPNSIGQERARAELGALVVRCLERAAVDGVDRAVFGLAGVNNRREEGDFENWLDRLSGLRSVRVENDSVIAWAAATQGQPGLVVIAGTGSIAFGIDANGNRRRAGGWGFVMGDEGSGFRIVSEALRACVRYHDGRGQWTELHPELLKELGLDSVEGLTSHVYGRGFETGAVASLVPAVIRVAQQGDPVARAIFCQAGQQLAEQALAVIDGLDLEPHGKEFPVGLSGGVFRSGALIIDPLAEKLGRAAPAARLQHLQLTPVFGAALLALQDADVPVDEKLLGQWRLSSKKTGSTSQLSGRRKGPPTQAQTHPRLEGLGVLELLEFMNQHDRSVARAVRLCLPQVAQAVITIARALRGGGSVYYVGAGTSGRIGVLDASECPPTFGFSPDRFQAVIAGGPEATWRSIEAAEDDEKAGAEAIDNRAVRSGDVVVGISASGTTPFTLAAIRAARDRGATTLAVTTSPGSFLADLADLAVEIPVGPEVVLGSTRLKAGTAQKLVLNMLSTGAAVQMGRVFGRFMIDLQTDSAKLKERAISMTSQLTGCNRQVAREALAACQFHVKTAVLTLLLETQPEQARSLLDTTWGSLPEALSHAGYRGELHGE